MKPSQKRTLTAISTFIIPLITVIGSIWGSIYVARMYIENQSKISEIERTSQNIFSEREHAYLIINDIYFQEGVFRIEAAISHYGSSTIYAFKDVNLFFIRHYDNVSLFDKKIKEIRDRPAIKDLINRNFTLASNYFSRIIIFGEVFYSSVKRTLQLYSDFLYDLLSVDVFSRELKAASKEELSSSLWNMTNIFQETEYYLETRCGYLVEYILQNSYQNMLTFTNIKNEEQYQNFLVELGEYKYHLDRFTEAFIGISTPEQRARSSKEFSTWLLEHNEINPFDKTS